jgi:hypothetical protein
LRIISPTVDPSLAVALPSPELVEPFTLMVEVAIIMVPAVEKPEGE